MKKLIEENTGRKTADLANALSELEDTHASCHVEIKRLTSFMTKMSHASVEKYPETTRLLKKMRSTKTIYQPDLQIMIEDACAEHGISG